MAFQVGEELKVGLVTGGCIMGIAIVLKGVVDVDADVRNVAWKASMPLLVYVAYLIKLKIRQIRDDPLHVSLWIIFGSSLVIALSALKLI